MDTNLLDFVTVRLAAYDGTIADLAKATGVGKSWLLMFRRGKIGNPGVQQIQLLADHFRSRSTRRARDTSRATA